MHLHLLYYIKNILLTSLLTFTIYIIIYLIYITQNYKLKLQVEDQYEKLLYKELSAINNVYKANLPIILSRNNTSITIYKKNKINIITNLTHKFFNNFIKRKRKILIAVHSHNSLFYHRYVFRKVYRRYKDIQLLFFMGLDYNNSINNLVYEEMKIYRDIVIFDFYCNYHNLHYQTYKFLLWIKDYKHLYKVIIKQDTDTFINIHLLNLVINDLIYKNNSFVFGRIWYYNDIKRKYPSGMSYIFLSKSINKLLCNIDKGYVFWYISKKS